MTTALVTGGTSGIGAAFTRALAARGHDLVLVARNPERLAQTAAEITERYGVEVEVLSVELGERAGALQVAQRLESTERPVDILVNNAGFGARHPLLDADTTPHEYAIDVMIRAVLILSAAAGRTMRRRGRGMIINVSSAAGYLTMGSYSAIKSWVTIYTESLANELTGSGVQVTALLPGWVRTEFHQRARIRTSKIPDRLWLDPDRLVADCLRDAERGKVISMPSMRYRALMLPARLGPRAGNRLVSRKLSSGRR